MSDDLKAAAEAWLSEDPDPDTRAELRTLLDAGALPDSNSAAELADRFAGTLEFGTAGLRGELGLHKKLRLRVHTLDGDVLAWIYVLDAYEGGLPSARYLGILAEAAEAAGAPDDYVADLRTRPCQSSGH